MYTSEQIEQLLPGFLGKLEEEGENFLNAYLRLTLGAKLLQPKRMRFQGNLYRPVNSTGAVDITRKGKWGNPYRVDDVGLEKALLFFERDLINNKLPFTLEQVRGELAGKDLICWCSLDRACHGDILISYANH